MSKFKAGDLCRGHFDGNSKLEATIRLTEPVTLANEKVGWIGDIVCVHFSSRPVTEKKGKFFRERTKARRRSCQYFKGDVMINQEELDLVPNEAVEHAMKAISQALILSYKEGYNNGHEDGVEQSKSLKKYIGVSSYIKNWFKSFKSQR